MSNPGLSDYIDIFLEQLQIYVECNYCTDVKLTELFRANDHSAFVEKANIPVYLVGSETALSTFSNLIPAPDETYTNLFLAHDNMELDKKLQDIKDKSMESKRKS